jgi:simple sugar transport system permease protein
MLNYVALHLVSMMIDGGPLQETAQRGPQSDRIVQWVFLPRIFPPHRVHLGIVMAVVLAILLTFILFRTAFGYQLRAVGEGADAAEAAGISIVQNTLRVFFISGALAGLGGAIELTALTRRLFLNFSPGYGYTAIAVALLAKLNPLVAVATALLFGALTTGSYSMQREVGISDKVTLVTQATILLFVIGYSSIQLFRKRASSQE